MSDSLAARTAMIADWLVTFGGAESVVSSMQRAFPAPIYALFANDATLQAMGLAETRVIESALARIPGARRRHRAFFPLFPLAIEQFDLSAYDLILSSSHAVAKSVLTKAEQLHVCYCHSPIRYVWDLTHEYLRQAGLDRGLKSWLVRYLLHRFRVWDVGTAPRVDHFIANSRYIAQRIRRVYGRESTVIYPPVDVDQFTPGTAHEQFYLTVSRLVPYKRVDLIVEAFTATPARRLVVVGEGPEMDRVRALAGTNVELVGFLPRTEVVELMRRARAFIFAANEDFGIVPVEAQACGTPVIAYGHGGALETVIDGRTGVHFGAQTARALIDAVDRFERLDARSPLDPATIRAHAERFARPRFEREYREFVTQAWQEFSQR